MVAWIEAYASMIAFFVQIAFYVVVAGSALWAAITFARYVKFMTSEDTEIVDAAKSGKSVEEFVD